MTRSSATHPAASRRGRARFRCSIVEQLEQRQLLAVLTGSQPAANSFDAPVDTHITAQFDQDVTADTVNLDNFVIQSSHGRLTDGNAAITTTDNQVTIDPADDFFPGDFVRVSATDRLRATGDEMVTPRVWEFRTAVQFGSGQFQDSGQELGAQATSSARLGDLDGDGDLDVFAANAGPNRVWLNDGAGDFVASGDGLGVYVSFGGALGDLDGDGDLDAFVANRYQGNRVWLNDGNGGFSDSGQVLGDHDSRGVSIGDLDGDGDLDAFVANPIRGNRVWFNDGNGVFEDGGQLLGDHYSYGVTLGDLDGDGDLDAFIANLYQANQVWFNHAGVFFDSGQSLGNHASDIGALGDVDGDGDLDVLVANFGEGNRLWLNDGNGVLTDSSQVLGSSLTEWVEFGDIDADGDLDALTANYAQGNVVWLNDGGEFTQFGAALGAQPSVDIALGDLDGDGDLDFFAGNGSPNRVWFNQNRDPLVTLATDDPLTEGGSASISVRLSQPSENPVTVDLTLAGTATLDTDFSISATQVVINPGDPDAVVTVNAAEDAVDDPDETIEIAISNVTNGQEDGDQLLTLVIMQEDAAEAFVVTEVTPTDSGVVVDFALPFAMEGLNLYDTSQLGLGDADVQLIGQSVGPVVGSLVPRADQTRISFIKSGGPLEPDTYELRIRSAADGFRDTDGNLLDGDMDGVAGADFVDSFIIDARPAGAITVSLPDFVRGPGQAVNLPADSALGIPLTLTNGDGVRTVVTQIEYDPALLQIEGATLGPGLPATANLTLTPNGPGTATVAVTSDVSLPAGEVVFVSLQAVVPSEASLYRQQQVLDLTVVSLLGPADEALPSIADDAVQLATFFGDVSANGRINAADAAQLGRVTALVDTGFGGTPLTDPGIVGDLTGNGRLNAADASLVARFAALIPVPQIPPIPSDIVVTAAAARSQVPEPPRPNAAPALLDVWQSEDWRRTPDLKARDAVEAVDAYMAELDVVTDALGIPLAS